MDARPVSPAPIGCAEIKKRLCPGVANMVAIGRAQYTNRFSVRTVGGCERDGPSNARNPEKGATRQCSMRREDVPKIEQSRHCAAATRKSTHPMQEQRCAG